MKVIQKKMEFQYMSIQISGLRKNIAENNYKEVCNAKTKFSAI